ncbi:PLDc N-terminal domain-containing protein [Sulfitobacter sp.]|uniref:PLDc N-terminal domain-containing protein n=1 Tax=Sulfitobacter sp. TaxID=1903071 RepID=UPI0032969AC8
MEWSILGLLVFIAGIYAIYHIVSSTAPTAQKVIWTIVVVVFPIIGFLVWLLAGPRKSSAPV